MKLHDPSSHSVMEQNTSQQSWLHALQKIQGRDLVCNNSIHQKKKLKLNQYSRCPTLKITLQKHSTTRPCHLNKLPIVQSP